jgi:hypothetical protein
MIGHPAGRFLLQPVLLHKQISRARKRVLSGVKVCVYIMCIANARSLTFKVGAKEFMADTGFSKPE